MGRVRGGAEEEEVLVREQGLEDYRQAQGIRGLEQVMCLRGGVFMDGMMPREG